MAMFAAPSNAVPWLLTTLFYALAAPAASIQYCAVTSPAIRNMQHWPRGERIAPVTSAGAHIGLRGGSFDQNVTVDGMATHSSLQETGEDGADEVMKKVKEDASRLVQDYLTSLEVVEGSPFQGIM